MFVSHLSLTYFRNYSRVELPLRQGLTLVSGANAQGKTNLLESLYYIATTRSPYTNQDAQLIHWEAGQFNPDVAVGRIVVRLQNDVSQTHLEMRLIQELQPQGLTFRREALVDRRKVRLMDLLGNLRVVLFLPQDVNLITGPPLERRRFLDITLCQIDRHYCKSLSAYNKVVEQRNALLRTIAERGLLTTDEDLLAIYTDKLVALGAIVFGARARFLRQLALNAQRIHYESLTEQQESIQLQYLPRMELGNAAIRERQAVELGHALVEQSDSDTAQQFRRALAAVQPDEFRRGRTLLGPHLDDWRFLVNGRSLAHFGSRGQQRTAMLALKLSEVEFISAETDSHPLLLLDDVMAELDEKRQQHLQAYLQTAHQAIVTTTSLSLFTPALLEDATVLQIDSGQISSVHKQSQDTL